MKRAMELLDSVAVVIAGTALTVLFYWGLVK